MLIKIVKFGMRRMRKFSGKWAAKFLDNIPDACFLFNKDLVLVEINAKALEFVGKSYSEIIEIPAIELANGSPAESILKMKRVMATGKPSVSHNVKAWPIAGERYVDVFSFRVETNVGVIVTDVTRRQNLELEIREEKERMKDLALSCIKSQEKERELISCEIHDRVIQLIVASCQLAEHAKSTFNDFTSIETLEKLNTTLKQTLNECRLVSRQIYPSTLAENNLLSLISEELNTLRNEGIESKIVTNFDNNIPKHISEPMYRIFHEAIINIQKHSKASYVRVTLMVNEGVELLITDNGCGFYLGEALGNREHIGIISMQRRAELAGGNFEVESKIGKGTSLKVCIPIEISKDQYVF
ncbi:sensor histidine kinase [Dehalococcoides mccartyi]|uniref:Sensor histidine kinase n=1 Tax=Dehalococcoides mccartyi TaxID=61435 RepID=A0A2J1E0A0_9CHLR|nr:sensor histidine kinase [Dehalococcoides mccartyi]